MAVSPKSALSLALGLALVATFPGLAGAGAQRYTHPEFANLTKDHKTIAILPFKVNIDTAHLPKQVTLEMIAKSEKEESFEFQRQLYARFLQRAQDGEYRVGFQDVDQTNALLSKAGIDPDSLALHTKDEIAKILGVDALVSGTIHQARPPSTGASIALSLFGGTTQRVDINMVVHNGADGVLLWSYDHTDKGTIGDSVPAMTKSLLKKVAGNFPYRVKT